MTAPRGGGKVKAYDPVAVAAARERIPEKWLAEGPAQIVSHRYEAVEDAHAMALVTEWKPFRQPDFRAMKRLMRGTAIFDGRNQYDPLRWGGFEYYGIARAAAQS